MASRIAGTQLRQRAKLPPLLKIESPKPFQNVRLLVYADDGLHEEVNCGDRVGASRRRVGAQDHGGRDGIHGRVAEASSQQNCLISTDRNVTVPALGGRRWSAPQWCGLGLVLRATEAPPV